MSIILWSRNKSRNHATVQNHRPLLVLVLVLVCFCSRLGAVPAPITTIVVEQPIDLNTTEHVNSTVEFIFQFTFQDIVNRSTSDVRVHVTTEEGEDPNYPVLFVVRQQKDVISWQLPQISKFDPGKMYSRASRTLCSETSAPTNLNSIGSVRDVENSITVTVSTSSTKNVTFSIRVTVEYNFIMKLGEDYSTHVSPPSPRFYRFVFPHHITQYVLLEVKSNDSICMTVSVQNSTCPVFDEESNVQFSGYWQTMSTQAGMTIRSDDFPNGFYVVFVVHTDDSRCVKDQPGNAYDLSFGDYFDRRKIIDFAIHEKISQVEYVVAITGMIGFFLLFYALSIVISCVYYCRVKPIPCPIDDTETLTSENGDHPRDQDQDRSIFQNGPATISEAYNAVHVDHNEDTAQESAQEQMPHHSRSRHSAPGNRTSGYAAMQSSAGSSHWLGDSDSSLDEVDIDFMDDANRYKDVVRTSRSLYVSALSRKKPRILAKKSQLYLWTLLTVAVFYALPVVQLVLTYQKVLHTTGNQDLCYYNYFCSHPLWLLSDFNHVYSNIGYIMLGILFIILVFRKERMHQKLDIANSQFDQQCGIPPHYGLFYTMGAALVMEGILSGCYHVCPNGSNFQFDTAFMYVIAMMCILRIYQARHPDINSSAFMAFASLAFVILIGVIGIMTASIVFWGIFTTLHVGVCLFLTIQIYYLGRWKLDCGLFSRIYLSWRNDCLASPLLCLRPLYIDRFILLMIANLVNWGVAALGIVNFTQPSALGISVDFATHLLFIFMSNLFLYTTFYILMKLAHREKILAQPATYITLSVIFWGLAGFVFLHKSTSWQMSPAESRTFNRECLILRFYDTHDLWHVLSASAMFFSFMMYLTLDDDLILTPRTRIPVF